jgi:calcineurin-like phosphoesterase family protein
MNRPWTCIEDMDNHLISNWNKVVGPNDLVFHLGDVLFHHNKISSSPLLDALNGKIVLIRGNHDKYIDSLSSRFESIKDYFEIRVVLGHSNYRDIALMHYPLFTWNKQHYGSYMLHGHCHGKNNVNNENCLRYDVGVDTNAYTPVSLSSILDLMSEKSSLLKSQKE